MQLPVRSNQYHSTHTAKPDLLPLLAHRVKILTIAGHSACINGTNILPFWLKISCIAICLAHASLVSAQSSASDVFDTTAKTLRYGCIEFSPYCYIDEFGRAQGSLVKLATFLCHQAGYQIEVLVLPPKRAIRMVADGSVDLWIGLPNIESYRDAVLRSALPITTFALDIYSLNPMDNFTGINELHSKRVAVIRGYTYGGLIDDLKLPVRRISFMEVADHVQATNALYRRNIDYMVGYRAGVIEAAKSLNRPVPFRYPIKTLDVFIMVPKAASNATLLLKKLEAAHTASKAVNETNGPTAN